MLGTHTLSWPRSGHRNKRSSFLHSLQERERRGAFPYGKNDKSNEFRLQCYVKDLQKINVPQKPRRYVVITSLSLQKGLDACFLHSTHDMRPIPVQRKPLCLPCLSGEEPLKNGHVFLGWTRDGNFILSYTSKERVGDRTLIYDYKLYWWRFQPGANLVKAAEINLFADADSNRTHMQELVLYVCEWGNSDYILVYGCPSYLINHPFHDISESIGETGDNLCHVTILAKPSLNVCDGCRKAKFKCSNSEGRCLRHGFSAHFRFELTSPYPFFLPTISLKINDVAVFNTGDGLVALCFDVIDAHVDRVYNSANANSGLSHSTLEGEVGVAAGGTGAAAINNKSKETTASASSTPRHLQESQHIFQELLDPYSVDSFWVDCMRNDASKENSSLNANRSPGGSITSSGGHSMGSVRGPAYEVPWASPPYITNSSSIPSQSKERKGGTSPNPPSPTFAPPIPPSRNPPLEEPMNVETEIFGIFSSRMAGSSSSAWTHNSQSQSQDPYLFSTSSPSIMSSPVVMQTETRTVTYAHRCYVSLPYTTATNEIDDPSLAYSAVLPLEVFGPGGSSVGVEGGTQLSLVTEATIPEITKETPGVIAQQLTLDVEQYLSDNMPYYSWADQVLSFSNYDIQILDVCPDTNSVVALLCVLLQTAKTAKPPSEDKQSGRSHPLPGTSPIRSTSPAFSPKSSSATRSSSSGPSYGNTHPMQAVIHFTWDLTSGDCSTLHVSDLQELEHEDSRDVWDPGWRVFSRHFLSGFIPAASGHCPRVLTTIPVCQQRSLPALYWRNFALTLHGYCPAKKHRAPLVSE